MPNAKLRTASGAKRLQHVEWALFLSLPDFPVTHPSTIPKTPLFSLSSHRKSRPSLALFARARHSAPRVAAEQKADPTTLTLDLIGLEQELSVFQAIKQRQVLAQFTCQRKHRCRAG